MVRFVGESEFLSSYLGRVRLLICFFLMRFFVRRRISILFF